MVERIDTNLNRHELQLIYDFVMNFFLGLLRYVKPKHLYYYINNNKVLDIRRYIKSIPYNIRIKLKPIASKNRDLVFEYFTPEKLLEKCREQRYDLYEVLVKKESEKWLKGFLKVIILSIKSL